LNLPPLKTPSFEMNKAFFGHNLAIMACGLSHEKYFYYRCPHENGAAFVAVGNAPAEVFSPVEARDFMNITIECINEYPLDHSIFIESFLEWNQTEHEWERDNLIAFFSKEKLQISFRQEEEHYRICSIELYGDEPLEDKA